MSTMVPFYSQWETRDLTTSVLVDPERALRSDPLWRSSGADDLDEYVLWANNICGMACLKMVIAARTGQVEPTLHLARAATCFGAYVVSPGSGDIKGLIYAPFVRFIDVAYGLKADVVTGLNTHDLPEVMQKAAFFMASVHPWIRWPDREPPTRGGHLVLVLSAGHGFVTFHNPSGHDRSTQESVRLTLDRFSFFFAGRGVAIY